MIKLWHDDERPAPDASWTVARTNDEALEILKTGMVIQADLDYVLRFPENGMELVLEMVRLKLIPSKVNIHSASWQGAADMASVLRSADCLDVTTEAAPL